MLHGGNVQGLSVLFLMLNVESTIISTKVSIKRHIRMTTEAFFITGKKLATTTDIQIVNIHTTKYYSEIKRDTLIKYKKRLN